MVDNKVTRNHISLNMIKQLRLPYKQKEDLYPLVMILGDLIIYRDKIIHFKTGLVKFKLKGRCIIILFNVLLLGKDKAVLKIPFLRKYNPKINWAIENIKL